MAKEKRKDVVGYEGFYKVSSHGKVVSTRYSHKQMELKPDITSKGYHKVKLCVNGIKKGFFVHRLVADLFIPNPEGKTDVNHKTGDKSDNSIRNLEWLTHAENMSHCSSTGLMKTKLTKRLARNIKANPKNLSCRKLAKIYGVAHGTIHCILKGKIRKHL